MKIITYPDFILRSSGLPVKEGQEGLRDLMRHLIATLQQSDSGVGLAANQIGFQANMFVMDAERSKANFTPIVIANPTFKGYGNRVELQEGCLSFPGVFERVQRWEACEAKYDVVDFQTGKFTRKEEALTGLESQIFQHETEHLTGKLLIDNLDTRLQARITKRMEKRKSRGW